MSYNSSQMPPRARHYDDYGMPEYDSRQQYRQPRQLPPSSRPFPPDARQADPHWNHPRYQNAFQSPNDESSYYSPPPQQQQQQQQQRLPFAPPRSLYAPQSDQTRPRGAPPARPPRPDYSNPYDPVHHEPTRHHPSDQQRHYHAPPQPSHHGPGEWTGDGYTAALSTALPPFQPQAHVSSLQSLVNQAQRRAPLGPPPSSRRGPSSYYSDTPPVLPIAEESDSAKGSRRNGSTRSYASSNAIPIGVPSYYLEDRESVYSTVPSVPDPLRPHYHYHSDSEGSRQLPDQPLSDNRQTTFDDRAESPMDVPVRQASVGKRSKPTLTTVRSSDRLKRETQLSATSTPAKQDFPIAFPFENGTKNSDPTHTQDNDASLAAKPYESASADGIYDRSLGGSSQALASPPATLGPSDPESDSTSDARSDPGKRKKLESLVPMSRLATRSNQPRSKSPLSAQDPRINEVLTGLEMGGAIRPSQHNRDLPNTSSNGTSGRVGKKRPPRINVDAVREAEERGSLTSLPDLIRRATKLASNLDRGKTASRLGMNAWLNVSGDVDGKRRSANSATNNRRSNASLGEMLAAFPSPALTSPTGSRDRKRPGKAPWSSNLRNSVALNSDSDADAGSRKQKKGKRCCGLPLWLFLILLVLAICIVAAAIIVPVVLVVIPQQRAANPANSGPTACQKQLTCLNGGANIVASDGSCQCLCVNGYTGTTCNTQAQPACTTINAGSMNNATVGNLIPRVINAANPTFGIPLNAATLLGVFSSVDLSCSSENALVTFSGVSKRDLLEPDLIRRVPDATTSAPAAATSDGIVFQAGTVSSSQAATPTSSSPSATASSASPSSSSSSDSSTVDFARTAVLYILQSSLQLNTAITAQQNLQNYFRSPSGSGTASNVSLGNGAEADLQGYTIKLENGTTVGGGRRAS